MSPDIGERIAQIRGHANQADFAASVQVAKNTLGSYERNERSPRADFLLKLHEQGWNLNWVVTGNGPERLADLQPQQPVDWDPELMHLVIEAVETALDDSRREMDPPDKAQLILSIYDLYAESGASPSTAKIMKLVRTTA